MEQRRFSAETHQFKRSEKSSIIIPERREKLQKHLFDRFLFELRDAGVSVSTSEWLDLQQVLTEKLIHSVDDLYDISKMLLVKDVVLYDIFDEVFARLFFGIELSSLEDDEDEEEDQGEIYSQEHDQELEQEGSDELEPSPHTETQDEEQAPVSDDAETPEEKPTETIQKEQEHIATVVEATSLTSELVHGGNEATKDIPDSPNAANEGQQENRGAEQGKDGAQNTSPSPGKSGLANQPGTSGSGQAGTSGKGEPSEPKPYAPQVKEPQEGGLHQGVGGTSSARQEVVERRYVDFRKDSILSAQQVTRALSRLLTILEEHSSIPNRRLEAKKTVEAIARSGVPELIFSEEQENKPKVMLMFDIWGSTDQYQPIIKKLFASAKEAISELEIYYFHNSIYGEVWIPDQNGNAMRYVSLNELLKKDDSYKIVVVGDAWMADYELPDDSFQNWKDLKDRFPGSVWLNPIKAVDHDEWDDSGTIGDIKSVFPMFDLTLEGIEQAVKELLDEK